MYSDILQDGVKICLSLHIHTERVLQYSLTIKIIIIIYNSSYDLLYRLYCFVMYGRFMF